MKFVLDQVLTAHSVSIMYNAAMHEIHVVVSGRVQGVSFRDYIRTSANQIGALGQVRNLPTGKVEVVAQGSKDTLNDLLKSIRLGSPLSKVEDIICEWREPSVYYDTFQIVF